MTLAIPTLAIPRVYWRKTISEIFLSFLVSFCFFFVVFLINQILLFAEDILSKGADLFSVLKLLFYSLPTVIAISVPFSMLAATLMTSSRQHADNEFMAASTLGINPAMIYVPFLVMGIAISAASFMANDWFMPRASNGFRKVYAELIHRAARIELTPYSVLRYGDRTIATGPSEGELLKNVLIVNQDSQPDSSMVSARQVKIAFPPDRYDALLSLQGILEQKALPGSGTKGNFAVTTAEEGEIRIRIQEPMSNFGGTGPSEMSAATLQRHIAEKQKRLDARIADREQQKATALDRLRFSYGSAGSDQEAAAAYRAYRSLSSQKLEDTSLRIYKLEYQKKFVIPSACFFFAFLAFPLGIGSKRAGRTAGFGLALLISVIYWALLFAGQTLGYRQGFDPVLSMWMPNAVLFMAGSIMWVARKLSTGHFL